MEYVPLGYDTQRVQNQNFSNSAKQILDDDNSRHMFKIISFQNTQSLINNNKSTLENNKLFSNLSNIIHRTDNNIKIDLTNAGNNDESASSLEKLKNNVDNNYEVKNTRSNFNQNIYSNYKTNVDDKKCKTSRLQFKLSYKEGASRGNQNKFKIEFQSQEIN